MDIGFLGCLSHPELTIFTPMARVILSVLCIWVATDAFAADEAVLFPDVTPATTTEFGYSKILEQELLVRLEGTGFMVLNGEVLSQGVREQMLLCAEDESCPAKPLAAVPARIALVVRAEKKDGKYQVDASVYQQGVAAALDSKQLLVGLDELPQTAQQIADFLDDTADTLDEVNPALRSMASQLIQAAGSGERVWIRADVEPCSGVYSQDDLLEHLDAFEDFLRFSDRQGGFRTARQMEEGLLCYQDLLTGGTARQLYARVFRAIGAGLFMGGQEQPATPWIVGAVDLDPQFEYGLEDMQETHPVWNMFRTLKALPPGEPIEYAGTILGPGEHYLNGQKIESPVARDGQKHLYQHKSEGTVRTWVIDGSRFPKETLEFIGLVATEKLKKSKDKTRKVATEADLQKFRGISMVETEPKVVDVDFHIQLRGGLGSGSVDRVASLRNHLDGTQWFQEGPSGSTRPRFSAYAGVAIQTYFEVGLAVGVQMAKHKLDAAVSGVNPGVYGVEAVDDQMKPHVFVQPRLQANLGKEGFTPYVFAGLDLRFVDGSGILTDSVSFAEVPAALIWGMTGGVGGRIGITDQVSFTVESGWTGHMGLRSRPVQQGTTPVDKPNPVNAVRQTIGAVGGIDVAF